MTADDDFPHLSGDPATGADMMLQAQRWLGEHREMLAVRGEIVSSMNVLEGWVDLAILALLRLDVREGPGAGVRDVLLSRLPASGKIDALAQLIERAGVADGCRWLPKLLKQANQARNDVAHSQLSMDPGEDWGQPWVHHIESSNRPRKGWQSVPAGMAASDANLEVIRQAGNPVIDLWLAAALQSEDEPLRERLIASYGRDPVKAAWRPPSIAPGRSS